MYKGSRPVKQCHHKAVQEPVQSPAIPPAVPPPKPPVGPVVGPLDPTPLRSATKKRKFGDVFRDQEGGRVQLVTPTQAAVAQAKARIRRCKRKKGCKQTGWKVYNPRHSRRRTRKRRKRKHG